MTTLLRLLSLALFLAVPCKVTEFEIDREKAPGLEQNLPGAVAGAGEGAGTLAGEGAGVGAGVGSIEKERAGAGCDTVTACKIDQGTAPPLEH